MFEADNSEIPDVSSRQEMVKSLLLIFKKFRDLMMLLIMEKLTTYIPIFASVDITLVTDMFIDFEINEPV